MECPFELPVKKEMLPPNTKNVKLYRFVKLLYPYTEEEADYIVQAINSHEKLAEACNHAYSFMICVSNLDNNENLKWQEDVTEELEQVLKEAEKQNESRPGRKILQAPKGY